MRRFGDRDMWAARDGATDARQVAMAVPELPTTAYDVTETSGASMAELHPVYLAGPNANAMAMTTASDYGTLAAAGRPM